MTRQEIVDEIVLKRDSSNDEDVKRVEELRQMLIEIDLNTVATNRSEKQILEDEYDQLLEKVTKYKGNIKKSILILSIIFLLVTIASLIISFWILLYGGLPILLTILVIYFATRKKVINLEVDLLIKEGKLKTFN